MWRSRTRMAILLLWRLLVGAILVREHFFTVILPSLKCDNNLVSLYHPYTGQDCFSVIFRVCIDPVQ